MNTLALTILWALAKTGLVLTLSAITVAVFLRVFQVRSPAVRRTACVAVLLQGWLFFDGPFSLPLPTPLSKLVGSYRVAWDQRAERARLDGARRGKKNLLSGTVRTQPEPPGEGDPSLVSTLGSPARASGLKPTVGSNEGGLAIASDRGLLSVDQKGTSKALPKIIDGPKVGRGGSFATKQTRTANQADVPPPGERPFPLPLALISLWATGIVVIISRSALAYLKFVRRFPSSGETPPGWADEWTALQLEAGLPGTVPLVLAEHAGPVLCRLPRGYCLIVPGEMWRTLELSQRLPILRHELAHVERRDVWKSLAMRVLALPHWFNPLAWRIVRRFDESAEWACDEAAARAAPDHIPDYARALLQLGHRAEPAFFAASAAQTHGLAYRIRRLLTPGAKQETKMKIALMAALLLAISLINVIRLQTRAEGTVQAPVADLNVVPAPVSKAIEVPFPVTKMNMASAPTIRVQMVPPTASNAKTPSAAKDLKNNPPQSGGLKLSGDEFSFYVGPTFVAPEARVNIPYILQHMRRFERDRKELRDSLVETNKREYVERIQMAIAKKRIEDEKDKVIRSFLDKGIAQRCAEEERERREWNDKLVRQEHEILHRNLQSIIDEIARYAKEHKILVVRRVPNRDVASIYLSPQAPVPSPGFGAPSVPPPTTSVWTPVNPNPLRGPWDQEIVYIADVHGDTSPEISDEIVKRLNAADAAKGTAPSGKSK